MAELIYEIVEEIGVISGGDETWCKELNIVSWNNKPAKFDLRTWSVDHAKMGKGITLSKEELTALRDLLNTLAL